MIYAIGLSANLKADKLRITSVKHIPLTILCTQIAYTLSRVLVIKCRPSGKTGIVYLKVEVAVDSAVYFLLEIFINACQQHHKACRTFEIQIYSKRSATFLLRETRNFSYVIIVEK